MKTISELSQAGLPFTIPVPELPLLPGRIFTHIKGFNGNADYIEIHPGNKSSIVNKHTNKRIHTGWILKECIKMVSDGVWKELVNTNITVTTTKRIKRKELVKQLYDLENKVDKLKELTKEHCLPINYTFSQTQHALANGLIKAVSVIEGTAPKYLPRVKEYTEDTHKINSVTPSKSIFEHALFLYTLKTLPNGTYLIKKPNELKHSIVELYYNDDVKKRGFGFNIKDGGDFIPLHGVCIDTIVTKVTT